MKKYEIAVIPGDGIGKEVVPVALHVSDAVSAKFGTAFAFRHFDWSCETQGNRPTMPRTASLDYATTTRSCWARLASPAYLTMFRSGIADSDPPRTSINM